MAHSSAAHSSMEQATRFLAALTARTSVRIAVAALVLVCALPVAAQRFDHGLLWRVEGGGAPASHVFGTVHVADPRVTQLPQPVARALAEARSLTVEVGLDPSSFLALANRMLYLDGRDLPGAVGRGALREGGVAHRQARDCPSRRCGSSSRGRSRSCSPCRRRIRRRCSTSSWPERPASRASRCTSWKPSTSRWPFSTG